MRLDGIGYMLGSTEFYVGYGAIIKGSEVRHQVQSQNHLVSSACHVDSPHHIDQHDRDPHYPQTQHENMQDSLGGDSLQMFPA